jgi:hypothetical protein
MSLPPRAAAIAGGFALLLVVLLGLGGAASRPAGIWIGLPYSAIVWPSLAGLLVLAVLGRERLRIGLALLPVLVAILLTPRLPGVAALTGPPLVALALAVVAPLIVATGRRPPPWLFVPVVILLYGTVAVRMQHQVGPQGDEPHYLMVADSLLHDGDLSLEADYAAGRYLAFHDAPLEPHYRVRGKHGEIYSLHAVGLSLLILPAYAMGEYPAVSLFLAFLAAFVVREVREGVRAAYGDHGLADGVGWLTALSPPLLHYSGLVFTEIPAALMLGFAWRRRRGLLVGLAIAFLPWLNVRYVAFAIPLLAYGLWGTTRLSERLKLVIPAGVSALASAVYHYVLYGFFDPRGVYGRRPELSIAGIPDALPGLFLDQEFGLLVYAPFLALAIPGLRQLWRRDRPRALVGLALVGAAVLIAASWHMWRGGFNPPGRFLVPVVPVLAVFAGGALGGGLRAGAAMLVGWSVWAGLLGGLSPELVHRDRDGTAPLFRAYSGAEEWTRLLPGYVLAEPDRYRLTAVWVVALVAALPWKRGSATAPRLAAASVGLLVAAGLASALSSARDGGRDAVRLVGRRALGLPGWSATAHATGEWGLGELDWGPLYEPHRHPEGVELGSRLPLPTGSYELQLDADTLGSEPPQLEAWPDRPLSVWRRSTLEPRPYGFAARFERRATDGPLTLRVRGGGPMLLKELRLVAQPTTAATGPSH